MNDQSSNFQVYFAKRVIIDQNCIVALQSLLKLYFQRFIPLYLENLKLWLQDVAGELQKFICTISSSRHILRENLLWWSTNPDKMQKNAIKKDFFKLTNNANFRFDCRNSANNRKFEPIIDEIYEIT